MKPKPKPLTIDEDWQRGRRTGRKWIAPSFETKNALKEAVARGQSVMVLGYGNHPLTGYRSGMYIVECTSYRTPTPWCAGVEVVDGRVVKVLPWRCAWFRRWRNKIRYMVVTTIQKQRRRFAAAVAAMKGRRVMIGIRNWLLVKLAGSSTVVINAHIIDGTLTIMGGSKHLVYGSVFERTKPCSLPSHNARPGDRGGVNGVVR